MRPRGEVRQALAQAFQQGPAEVKVAAHRAQVGLAVARYTASRMVDAGELVVVHDGRPAVLAVADAAPRPPSADVRVRLQLDEINRRMWGML